MSGRIVGNRAQLLNYRVRPPIVKRQKVKEIAPMFKGAFVLAMKDRDGSEIQVSERHSKYVRELLKMSPLRRL